MSIHILSLAIINGITGFIFFKYTYNYIYTTIIHENALLLSKINKLQCELHEVYETIDILEEKLQEKEIMLKQSSDRIDKFIICDYHIN